MTMILRGTDRVLVMGITGIRSGSAVCSDSMGSNPILRLFGIDLNWGHDPERAVAPFVRCGWAAGVARCTPPDRLCRGTLAVAGGAEPPVHLRQEPADAAGCGGGQEAPAQHRLDAPDVEERVADPRALELLGTIEPGSSGSFASWASRSVCCARSMFFCDA